MSDLNPQLAERLYEELLPICPGLSVELVAECDSTNTQLLQRARRLDFAPCLLVTERQTAGRGRMGRQWESGGAAADTSALALTFSLGLVLAPLDWSGLSLVVGASLAQSLHPDIRIKWPNDLWLHGRKLAGILIETVATSPGNIPSSFATSHPALLASQEPRYVVIGVGINLQAPKPTDSAADWSVPAAGLRELLPEANRASVLGLVMANLLAAVKQFEHSSFAAWQSRFAARDALAGSGLRLSDGMEGLGQGVDATGALLVHTSQGLQTVRSAEVSVRLQNPTH
jgi:BirA family transcriptional regulator, biotin operon repressor / biotin---[acetyl-CoA-carboxylase] ligase